MLRIILKEYIESAVPVASDTISRNYRLGVSPATVRNDMAYLEKTGFILRPHISAGAVPLNKAYRYYVNSLIREKDVPESERNFIGSIFRESGGEIERWPELAANMLARFVRTMAVVTAPRAYRNRFNHLELISLRDVVVMLVLVLHDSKLKRQFLSLETPVTEAEMNGAGERINQYYRGLNGSQIRARKQKLTAFEQQITDVVLKLMEDEDNLQYEEPHFDGLRLMLSQPEFISGSRLLNVMDLVETREWLKGIFSRRLTEGEVTVVIGDDTKEEQLKDLSLIFTRYGIPERVGGAIGVVGPVRMDYRRAISTVRYMSDTLSELMNRAFGSN